MKHNCVTHSKQKLQTLVSKSADALTKVDDAIGRLEYINYQIDVTIDEIKEAEEELENTRTSLEQQHQSNLTMVQKFKELISNM